MSDPNSTATNGATPSAAAGDGTDYDPMARLEAAGIEDEGDAYEDLSELDGAAAEALTDADPLEGAAETPAEETPLEGEEGDPRPDPEDAIGLKGKGTREAPLKHKELPADKFVEVKNSAGERVVVNLKDALSGTFMSRDKVDREVSSAREAKEHAETLGVRALEHMRRATAGARQLISNTLGDPEALVNTLVESAPGMEVLRDVAKAYAMMIKHPELRQQRIATIRERRIASQSADLEERRQATAREEQERAQQAQLERDLKPAYRAGLKAAGILRKEDITEELSDGIRMRYQFIMGKRGKLTPAEMTWCVTDAAKALKADGKLKPPPKPRAAPAAPTPTQTSPHPSNGKVDWNKVPESVRMRDPAFLFDKAARASVRQSS